MQSINSAISEASGSDGKTLEFEKEFYEALVFGTKASNAFTSDAEEYEYLQSNSEFRERVGDFKNRLTGLLEQFAVQIGGGNDSGFDVEQLKVAEASDPDAFEPISDIVDLLLENADNYVDRAKGGEQASLNTESVVSSSELVRRVKAGMHGVITHANIMRPQMKFSEPVDNSRPPIQSISDIRGAIEKHARDLGMDTVETEDLKNPYEAEIFKSFANTPSWLFEDGTGDIPPVKSLEETPLKWVDKLDELQIVCEKLKKETAIAVDLENHSYRTFQGFLCLMQVSTPTEDFLIDTLALRSELHLLNSVFTDPTVLKVMHGADSDVQWLQRDFGICVVSLFDTGQAARLLQYPSAGLAYSLKLHCNVTANKAFQLADWRMRPLPEMMARYAREDTHYLLHIFETMRRDLARKSAGGPDDESNLVREVLRRSRDIALTVYASPVYSPFAYKRIVKRRSLRFSAPQLRVLAALHEWTDRTARAEDESEEYVLPQRVTVRIAQAIPVTNVDLENCCNPVPPVLRVHQAEVLRVIKEAKTSSLDPAELAYRMAVRNGDVSGEPNRAAPEPATPSAKVVVKNKTEEIAGTQVAAIGVNSSRTTFVPISEADASRWTPRPRSRMDTLQHEDKVRATPSPVLTTEQLYDTAGWQDVLEPSGTVSVVATSARAHTINLAPSAAPATGAGRAAVMRSDIGRDHLSRVGQGFSDTYAKTPFATMATAMAAKASVQEAVVGRNEKTNGERANSMDIDLMAEDIADTTGDSPADTEALESENIPKSMAEIYRISNRNRKRNKEKKKIKDEAVVGVEDGASAKAKGGRKRTKSQPDPAAQATVADEEAVSFMADIGWVDPALAASGGVSSVKRPDVNTSSSSNRTGHNSRRGNKPKSPRKNRGGKSGQFEYSAAMAAATGAIPSSTTPTNGQQRKRNGASNRGGSRRGRRN